MHNRTGAPSPQRYGRLRALAFGKTDPAEVSGLAERFAREVAPLV